MKRHAQNGFTLVELSIVLVILGLLVGGVLSGQSLIHAAELRAVTREYQQYHVALGAFKDKYFALPGDMKNAVKYWGAQAGSATADGYDSTCAALGTAATGLPTCNGNGDGTIDVGTYAYEMHRSWQHLSNAGLVEGTYAGIATPSGDPRNQRVGTNMPRSKIAGAGWMMGSIDIWSGNVNQFTANYGVVVQIGANSSAGYAYMPVMKAEDAYNIDMKMDDGKPHQGKILSYKNALTPNCVPASNDQYSLTNTTIGCSLIFITGY